MAIRNNQMVRIIVQLRATDNLQQWDDVWQKMKAMDAMNTEISLNFLAYCQAALLHPSIERRNEWLQQQHQNWREAAVLLPFSPDAQGNMGILLTRRATHLRQHAGQIAFAGGKKDAHDANLVATALRETWEETRILPDVWHISGSLKPFFTPSGYVISPILACTHRQPEIFANMNEVAETFWLPAHLALDLDNYGVRQSHWRNHVFETPVLYYQHHEIWGVTALILQQLAWYWCDFQAA